MYCHFTSRVTTIFTALLLSLASWGQEMGFVTLYGHVSDSGTSESLYYASVKLSGTSVHNVSNSEGQFSLKIPEGTPRDTEVLVSHLGYRTGYVKVSTFDGCTADSPLEISLAPEAIQLDSVTVRSIDPEALIRSAFYKVKDNYPTNRVGMTAFYREMVRKSPTKYLALNEAVLDIDKASYTSFASDKAGIYKGRGSINYDPSDTLILKFQGGIITALKLDQVKNPFAGLYMNEALMTYDFYTDGVATYDGHTFYKIGFKPKENVKDLLFKGSVFIETESLAIGRVEMEMDLEGREEEAASILVIKRPANTRFFTDLAKYVVTYKCFEGKWYYDYCRVDINFITRRKNSLFKRNYFVTEEMAITDHKEGGIDIDQTNRVKYKDILTDKVADFVDENFWEDYNIIEPDQSIDAIIKKIVRQLSRRK